MLISVSSDGSLFLMSVRLTSVQRIAGNHEIMHLRIITMVNLAVLTVIVHNDTINAFTESPGSQTGNTYCSHCFQS